ncbi:hypothetical protein FRC00_000564 [Tulasnella sp. 408]|nr:hypothetical protein FRC00_000564 [Tulasnella sp. 408]
MNALQTPLRTSKRLPAQLSRRWASNQPSQGSATRPEAERTQPNSAGKRQHKTWKAATENIAEKKVALTSEAEAAAPPSKVVLQGPGLTSIHKLKRMLDPSAPFFSGRLPLTPPALSVDPSSLSRSHSMELLRSAPMTKHLKGDPNARRVASLSPTQLARNVLTRNQSMSNGKITESLRTIRKLAESKGPVASA